MVTHVGGLGQRLHAEGVVGQAGDVEGAGDAAGGQHDVVVRLVDDLVGDGADDADLRLEVHADRTARDDPGAVLLAAAQRDGDRLRCQHAGGDLGQQRQVELVGEGRHQCDVGFVRGEFAFQTADALHSGEACANHQDPGSCHGVHPFLRLQAVCLERLSPARGSLLRTHRSHSGTGRSASRARQADDGVEDHHAPPAAEAHRVDREDRGAEAAKGSSGGQVAEQQTHVVVAFGVAQQGGEDPVRGILQVRVQVR